MITILLVHLCHQGFPKAQFLALCCFCYIRINDITTNINSQLHLFAGDCLIYTLMASPADHQILQNDLNTLDAWSRTWQMEFIVSKYKILQVSTQCTKSLFSYQMCDIPLEIVEQHNYQEVCLHHRMSWKPHIELICNKANCLLGFLYRNL